jgi:hypothetical protein
VPRLEFVVEGVPASRQSSARRREQWQEAVRRAAREAIREEDKIDGECRGIVVYLYFETTLLDVDNIVKPISDALVAIAYGEDSLVSEWIVRKTDLERTQLDDPPPPISRHIDEWLAAKQPFVYICVVDEAPKHAELPR